MGQIHQPAPVLPIVAVTSRYDDALLWAQDALGSLLGTCELTSQPFPFDQTDYYRTEMGDDLKKQLLAFLPLQDPEGLAEWKHRCNAMEEAYVKQQRHSEARPLNLDPGYLSDAKLVLASTKNHAHRIYLQRGIYAEITLHYQRGVWQPLPWTYPDYRTEGYQQFFLRCREKLRQQSRSAGG